MALNPIRWWHWLPRFSWHVAGLVEHADEVPDRLPSKAAVVVGTENYPKWIAFDCPCRSGHRIMIPLDNSHDPHWTLRSKKPLTIYPSVDFRTHQKRCHYFIRGGRVLWAHD